MNFKQLDNYSAITEIYSNPEQWQFLCDCLEVSGEVEYIDGEVVYLRSRHTSYTNESVCHWYGGYSQNSLESLQLIRKERDVIDIIAIEKSGNSKCAFPEFLEFLSDEYPEISTLTVFPVNDSVREYYKRFGFVETESGLTKVLR